ncbi:MAG: Re/Si-specific NAD(P)(+) transhydrogenase subunit alpha [Thermoplasmatales archaeon]|nr:Re/Si-specific NAD(P)(+) transhydrogenase subunit alpha [Thermoplasmatales archaeon]
MGISVGVPKETAPGERRVALVPEVVARLVKQGVTLRIQSTAGESAGYPDDAYAKAGATIVPDAAGAFSSEIVLKVQGPSIAEVALIPRSSILVAQMNASRNLPMVRALRDGGQTAFALELLPRISRAQSMDVLSSQATVAGYRAALIGAELVPKFFPMLTTAAGTIRPAKVLVLGAGVAGLMAIATAHRMGAIVEGYDVRRAAGEQVRSLGAKFLELQINAEGQGGYARELTPEEKAQEAAMVDGAVADADVVITTAAIPGRKAPILVRAPTIEKMRPGSVIVDLAAETGGNCELTKPGERIVHHSVTIVGPLNLPSDLAVHASLMFAKNLQSFLGLLLTKDGGLVADRSDEILVASQLVSAGQITHAPTRELVEKSP